MAKRKATELPIELDQEENEDEYQEEEEPPAKKSKTDTEEFRADTTKNYTKTDLNQLKKSDLITLTLAFQELARKQGHTATSKQSKKKVKEVDVEGTSKTALRKINNQIQKGIDFKKHSGKFEITRIEREVFLDMFPQYNFKPTNLVLTISCNTLQEIEKAIGSENSYRYFRFRGKGTLTKLIIRHLLEDKRITVSFQYKITGLHKGDDDEQVQ